MFWSSRKTFCPGLEGRERSSPKVEWRLCLVMKPENCDSQRCSAVVSPVESQRRDVGQLGTVLTCSWDNFPETQRLMYLEIEKTIWSRWFCADKLLVVTPDSKAPCELSFRFL